MIDTGTSKKLAPQSKLRVDTLHLLWYISGLFEGGVFNEN